MKTHFQKQFELVDCYSRVVVVAIKVETQGGNILQWETTSITCGGENATYGYNDDIHERIEAFVEKNEEELLKVPKVGIASETSSRT